MTTTDPTIAGLYRAVLLDPADDGPRLVLADYLDEHGEGERAEFVRVQCERAKMVGVDPACARKNSFGRHTSTTGDIPCIECWPRRYDLARRTEELLGDGSVFSNHFKWFLPWSNLLPSRSKWEFRRGFVDSITLPLAAFMGPCPRCAGSRTAAYDPCPACAASGSMAAALVLAAPLTRIVLADREPCRVVEFALGSWTWFEGNALATAGVSGLAARMHLPSVLFRLLPARYFDTEDAALAALSAAALLFARRLAHLETTHVRD